MVDHMTEVPATITGNLATARTSTKMQAAYVQQAKKYLEQR